MFILIGALPSAEMGKPCREVELMSFWVRDCIQHHSRCANNSPELFVPTRLLDLKAFERSSDLKLVTFGVKSVVVNYVALSHCWGQASKGPLTTKKENLAQHSQRISINDLSLTFKDAVRLTLDLRQRYLWIDSLCIVQDDAEDWASEASKMASVYENAVFTLSALSSIDSTYGCRISNLRAAKQDHRFFDLNSGPYRIRLFEQEIRDWHQEYGDDTYRHGEYGRNPLRTRAWTLQERELSTRNIHFSENLVLWECNTLKASSELPYDNLKPMDDFQPWPVRDSVREILSSDGSLMIRDRWYELMEDYMSRDLTKTLDKLPALSGLAQSFQRKMPSSKYLAGLWSDHLPRALLWRMGLPNIGSDAQRPTVWRAPSWSFLSLDGNMTYESQRLYNGGGSRPEETIDDHRSMDLLVREHHTQPISTDFYGTISKAELSLRGKIMRLRIRNQLTKDCQDQSTSTDPFEVLETTSGSTAGVIYFDVRSESLGCTQVWCLPVCSDPSYSVVTAPYKLRSADNINQEVTTCIGLAMQRDKNISGTFQRVGIFRWVDRSLFNSVNVYNFILI